MFHLLYKYLVIYKQVAIPGVGIFYIDRKPAKHDRVNKVFQSPVLHIDFKAGTAITDKQFFQFVSKEKGIAEVEAIKHLHDFAHNLKQRVSANRRVELPGLGALIKNGTGQVSFEPDDALTTYFPPVIEERLSIQQPPLDALDETVVIPDHQEELPGVSSSAYVSNDYWWVFAIILGVIGIAAILYYYYQNGTLM